MIRTNLCDLLGIEYPIIQDGMGGYGTGAIAAAVSEAGGLGTASVPGLNLDPADGVRQLKEQVEYIASKTSKPYAVNIPVGRISTGEYLPTTKAYVSFVCELKRSDSEVARNLVAAITSAGFPGDFTEHFHRAGLVHIHKVGSVKHAVKAVKSGVDGLIASGYEMGGHTHLVPVHTMVLVPQVVEAAGVPVVASGGIYDARGVAAALAMGAAGVAMGTRFIASKENDWHENYKMEILKAQPGSDVVTSGVYGPARMLRTAGLDRLRQLEESGEVDELELASWKDRAMRAAMRDGDVENGMVLAGQSAFAIQELIEIREFIPSVVREAAALLKEACRAVQ